MNNNCSRINEYKIRNVNEALFSIESKLIDLNDYLYYLITLETNSSPKPNKTVFSFKTFYCDLLALLRDNVVANF